MTVKDLMKREKDNGTALSQIIETRITEMEKFKEAKKLYDAEKNMLDGIIHTLYTLHFITEEEFFQLIDDIIENY